MTNREKSDPRPRVVSEKQLRANRANAGKSTGPKTEEGKGRVRHNALKHGLRAETLLLPGEDPAALEARRRDWENAVSPRNALEAYYLDEAVAASWKLDRCRRHDTAVVARDVRRAEERFDEAAEDALDQLRRELPSDPARVARKLRRSARGCAWAAETLETLIETVETRGWWTPTERDRALNLLGRRVEDVFTDGLAYDLVRVFLAAGWSTRGEALRVQGLLRAPAPEGMGTFEYRNLVEGLAEAVQGLDPEAARTELVALIRPEAEKLARLAATLAEDEAPDRAGAADRASIDVGPEGQTRLRYETARRREVQAALRDLIKTRNTLETVEFREDDPEPAGPAEVLPNKPISPPAEAAIPRAKGYRGPRLAPAPDLMGPSLRARAALGVPTDRHLHPHDPCDPQPEALRRFADELEAGLHDWVYDDEPPGTLPHH